MKTYESCRSYYSFSNNEYEALDIKNRQTILKVSLSLIILYINSLLLKIAILVKSFRLLSQENHFNVNSMS